MKNSRFLLTFILVFTLVISACGTASPTPSSIPTQTLPTKIPVPPIQLPTPELLTERLGDVWVSESNILADYVYRSFLQIPGGMAWGLDGHLYVADSPGHHIVRIAKDGTMDDLAFWKTVMPLQYDGPRSVAFDSRGNLYTNNHGHIFRVDTSGNVTELQGIQGSPVGSIAISATDELYYTDRAQRGALRKWNPAGYSETVVDNLPFAENMAFGLDGTLYLTQMNQGQVLKIDVITGAISTFKEDVCGNDPCFLAVDPEGDIWVRGINRLSQFTPGGVGKPFIVDGEEYPGGPYLWSTAAGIAFDDEGGLWIAAVTSKLMRLVPLTPGQPDPEFTMQVIYPGLYATDLEVGPNSEIVAPDSNTKQLLRFTQDGKVEVLAENLPDGNTAVAMDSAGIVYLGLPTGEIVRLDPNGTLAHYARLLTRRMTFGADGALYAVSGDWNRPKSIVRITDVDTFSTLATQIDGISLGNGEAHISPAQDMGLYVLTEWERNLLFVDFNGKGHLIANLSALGGGSGPVVMAASPVTGDIYFIPHGPYKLYRINAEGNTVEAAKGIFGDPCGMFVSSDGNWLYVAESGAIDKIPISNNPN